jgi:hypothetical protein
MAKIPKVPKRLVLEFCREIELRKRERERERERERGS